jgi:predicted DNA-binding transcriptional regulator AlpA
MLKAAALRRENAAHYCALSVRSFERQVACGNIKPRRVGSRTVVFLVSELDEFLASLPVGGGDAPPEGGVS